MSCRLMVIAAVAVAFGGAAHADDELSGADKLRALYSAEFRFTRDGVPVVPVAVADGLSAVTIAGAGVRLLPDGEGGADLHVPNEDGWQIRALDAAPARLRYWTIVWKGRSGQVQDAAAESTLWKSRGETARTFEQGTLFAVSGEVLDRRELLVAVGPAKSFEDADRATERLSAKGQVGARGVYVELVERPHGVLEAVGVRTGVRIKNEGVLWFVPGGDAPLKVDGRGKGDPTGGTYHGRLYVTFDRRGEIAVVNALPEDRLLAGLLPAEMFPNAPDEALKAQAVAARGQLLTKIGTRHSGDPYRLCSRTHCQVYAGAGRETPRATAAVAATRGEVLFTGDGKDLVDTVYSANSGGHTENNENVWPDMRPASTLRGVWDTVDAKAGGPSPGSSPQALASFLDSAPRCWSGIAKLGAGDRFRWTVTRSPQELDKLLAPLGLGALRSIEVLERGVSGRAMAVRLVGARRTETVRGELRIRQTFGNLRSSLFVVSMDGGAATFKGAGFGHGVGMCQTGAVGMAENGKSHRQILQHYYSGSALRKLW